MVPKKVPKKRGLRPEEIEEMRARQELEDNRRIQAEKLRIQEETARMIEKERKDQIDARIREDQLEKSVKLIESLIRNFRDALRVEKEEKEWKLYLQCRKLPTPALCGQMTTFLRKWEENMTSISVREASEKTMEIMQLINELEEVMALTTEDDQHKLPNWYWVRQLFRDQQKICLDIATYRLMRNITKNMESIDIPTAEYNFKDSYITLCLWLSVQTPIPMPNPRKPPRARLDISFPNLHNLKVLMPYALDGQKKAMRVMYVKYDHLSDTCESSEPPPIPPQFELDLLKTLKKEWRLKMKYKYDNRDKNPEQIDPNISDADPRTSEKEEFDSDEDIPSVPYKALHPSPSEYFTITEEKNDKEAKKIFMSKNPTDPHILNLRKYTVLGGVFYLNYIYQPPQPQDFASVSNLSITRLFLPKELQHVEFFANYEPPTPMDPNVRKQPEQIEEEMKKQEEALDGLICLDLTWPQHVIFLELPIVCVWLEKEKLWSRKFVHDLKHNEEKGTMSFKSQLFGIFGLATLRYANLPFQAWDIKPESNGSVTINITTAIIILEFNIKYGLICLSQLQNSPNRALSDEIGKYVKLHAIKKMLKSTGIDIFPEQDAYCYIEGSCEKHWPMEKHLYSNMAVICGVFNFAWSRWNASQAKNIIVLQMREYALERTKQKSHSLLLVNPLKTFYIQCTEVSQVFCDEPVDGSKFTADLLNLMRCTTGIFVRKKIEAYSKQNICAIYEFLVATRVLSFS